MNREEGSGEYIGCPVSEDYPPAPPNHVIRESGRARGGILCRDRIVRMPAHSLHWQKQNTTTKQKADRWRKRDSGTEFRSELKKLPSTTPTTQDNRAKAREPSFPKLGFSGGTKNLSDTNLCKCNNLWTRTSKSERCWSISFFCFFVQHCPFLFFFSWFS